MASASLEHIRVCLNRLIEPSPAVVDAEARRQARVLAGLLIFGAGIFLLNTVINLALNLRHPIYALGICLCCALGYFLSRTQYYFIAALIVIALITVAIFDFYLRIGDAATLGGLSVLLLVCALVFGLRVVLVTAAAQWLGLALLGLLFPQANVHSLVTSALSMMVVVVMSSIIVINRRQNMLRIDDQTRQLRESEARYRAILEAMAEGVVLSDQDGSLNTGNVSAQRITGLTLEQLTGAAALPPGWRIVAEDGRDFDPMQHPGRIALQTGQPQHDIVMGIQRGEQGTTWLSCSAQPVFASGQSGAYAVVGSFTDITERRRAEAVIRASEARFRALFEQANDGIFLLGMDGVLLAVNRRGSEMLGYEPAEMVGKHSGEAIVPEERDRSRDVLAALLAGQQLPLYEHTFERKDGSRFIAEVNVGLVRDADNQPVCIQSILRDITERKRVEQQRLELETERAHAEALRQFLSNTSHDLRTPISVMNTSLYLLRRKLPPSLADDLHHLEAVEKQTERLTKILDDMSSMSRLDEDDVHFEYQKRDLNLLIRRVVTQYEIVAAQKRHRVCFVPADEPVMIHADEVQMTRVMHGLLKNALAYTPEGGTITITVRKHEQEAIFEVTDTGIGISPDDLPHIFERFFRADNARPIDKGGAGLGLAIARKIIERHSGSIRVSSALDQGSAFTVCLPLAAPAPVARTGSSTQ